MKKTLIIGAGGVGRVVAHKCAQLHEVFGDILLASRTVSKCDAIAADIREKKGVTIKTAAVDADDVAATASLIRSFGADIVINVARSEDEAEHAVPCEAGPRRIHRAARRRRAARRHSS